jgi:ubiquinone/menaquinone biosynthesis C-methylase UbiE
MPDYLFEDHELAALYDLFAPNEGRGDFEFYLPLVMSADSVLDVGCGTGALLSLAHDRGHQGRLVGLDPATGMLDQARKQQGVEWLQSDLSTVRFDSEFDLVVMSGHAFQVLVGDEEISGALSAVRDALKGDGRFAFETRNPAILEWERWDNQYSGTVVDASGAQVRMEVDVEHPVVGDIVRFSQTF